MSAKLEPARPAALPHTGGRWIIAGTLATEMYPCRCEEEDPHPLEWKVERARRSGEHVVYTCDPYLKKGTGQWMNRCPCWGQEPDGRPEGCCAHHEGNPRFRIVVEGLLVAPCGPEGPVPAAYTAALDPGERYTAPLTPAPLPDLLHPPEPYRPRWPREELHCACPTPWDDDKRIGGYHCVGCCTNWRSYGASTVHQKSIMNPCRPPESIRDCVTGAPVLRAQYVGVHVVWG